MKSTGFALPSNALIQFPSGRWGFVGRVDARLSMSGTPEEIETARRFGEGLSKAKRLSWATREEAVAAAAAIGAEITTPTKGDTVNATETEPTTTKAPAKSMDVKVAALRLAAAFTSTDKTRPALMGVRVEKGNVIATDGHVLVKVPNAAGAGRPVTLPNANVKAIVKNKVPTASVSPDGDCSCNGVSSGYVVYDDPYPNTEMVMPKAGDGKFSIYMNPAMLADALKALAAYLKTTGESYETTYGWPAQPVVRLTFQKEGKPLVIETKAGVVALAMPVMLKEGWESLEKLQKGGTK